LKAKPKQIAKAGIGSSAADKAIEHDNHSAVTICASRAMDAGGLSLFHLNLEMFRHNRPSRDKVMTRRIMHAQLMKQSSRP
jgi:hypothetical protein